MRSSSSNQITGARRGRLIAGLLGLLLSLAYGQQAWTTLPMGRAGQPGAAVFPMVVAVLMALSSLAIILEEIRSEDSNAAPLDLPGGADLRRYLGVIASLVAYVVLAYLVGHLIGSVLLSLALVHLIKPGSVIRTVVVGLAVSLSAYGLFEMLLGVPLPPGAIW